MRFRFIDAEKAFYPLTVLCHVLKVSRSGYYAYVARGESDHARRDTELTSKIVAVFEASRGRYGSPRIHRALQNEGERVSVRRVERLMRQAGLVARQPRRWRQTTLSNDSNKPEENILNREFSGRELGEVLVSDITFLPTPRGFMFLAVVLDLASREVIGWDMKAHMRTELCLAALDAALLRKPPTDEWIHHSDRGSQYTSGDYLRQLKSAGATISMSRKGNCWDNAPCESFFSTLKTELFDNKPWKGSNEELRAALFEYIEVFYNRQRLHSALGYQTPLQAHQQLAATSRI